MPFLTSLFNIDNLLGMILPIILNAVKAILDSVIKGEELNQDQRKLIYTAWVESKLWARKVVEDSTNPYDDEALQMLWDAMQDIATEAGFTLPEVPEEF